MLPGLRWLCPLKNPPNYPAGFFYAQILSNRCGLLYPAGGAYENYENYENYEICEMIGAPMSNNHPIGISSPAPNQTETRKPTGYHMACHGVARQGEDGRPRFVRQVRHKRRAAATRIPPLPSNKHTPTVTLHLSHTKQRHANPRGIP